MEEPVRVVDSGNAHDYGEPGPYAAAKRFDGFAALSHAVGDAIRPGPEAEIHAHMCEALHLSGWDQPVDKDYLSVYLHLCAPRPERWREGGCHAAPDQPRRQRRIGPCARGRPIWGRKRALPGPAVWGFGRFISRADVLNARNGWLNDGAITVEADIRVYSKIMRRVMVPSVARHQRLPPPVRERRELGRHLHRRR